MTPARFDVISSALLLLIATLVAAINIRVITSSASSEKTAAIERTTPDASAIQPLFPGQATP